MAWRQTRGAEPSPQRLSIEIPWRTIAKLLLAAVLVWIALTLREVVLVFVVAVLLAVALDPAVRWLERHGFSRGWGVALVSAILLAVVVGALMLSWSSLIAQSRLTVSSLEAAENDLLRRAPFLKSLLAGGAPGVTSFMSGGVVAMRALTSLLVVIVFGYILTMYLLMDGARTYRWIRTFVPHRYRDQVDASARETRRTVAGYVAGNIATSIFAAVFVFASLSLLRVPAALMLAVVAGLFDFVPVLGFICSVVPALLLATTRSGGTALIVLILYVAYHLTENYFIAPKVYGQQLRLSDTAVLLAFAAGAALGGVVGALIALPIAAAYPCIEEIWLSDRLHDVVDEHRRIEHQP
jgi:predicted PurR-regulated permease PerM